METRDGLFGIGEAPPCFPLESGSTPGFFLDVINDFYGPSIVGQDATNLNLLHELMDKKIWGDINLDIAKAAVDCALYDVVGKTLYVPAVELIGGRVRTELPGYVGIGVDTPARMAKEGKKVIQKFPWKYLKVKVGGGWVHSTWPVRVDPETDYRRLVAVREAVGDRVTIIADPNQSYSPSIAIVLANRLESDPALMLEQPVDASDLDGLSRVLESTKVPIIADESAFTPSLMMKVIRRMPVEYFNIKPSHAGGFHGAMQMIKIVEAAGLKCTIDCLLESRLGGTMIAHLAAELGKMPSWPPLPRLLPSSGWTIIGTGAAVQNWWAVISNCYRSLGWVCTYLAIPFKSQRSTIIASYTKKYRFPGSLEPYTWLRACLDLA